MYWTKPVISQYPIERLPLWQEIGVFKIGFKYLASAKKNKEN